MGKTNKKEELSIPTMILSIVGVVLVVLGVLLLKNGNFKLNVISTEGVGTEFIFTLPLSEKEV